MKKIKLLTSTALIGMTAGAALPMVTSCGESTYANIKFKLDDGIAASAPKFTIGDKVVVDYKIIDEEVAITSDCITVLFDGWKVKSGNKTWKYDLLKKKITIFAAPTTDITVKIRAVSYDEENKATISLSSEQCIFIHSGEEINSISVPVSYTYQQVTTMISLSYDEQTLQFEGWKLNGVQLTDYTATISDGDVLTPIFGDITPSSTGITVPVYLDPNYGKLGRIKSIGNDGSESYSYEWTFDPEDGSIEANTTFAELFAKAQNNFVPFHGCKLNGFVNNACVSIMDQKIKQYIEESYEGIYISFAIDSEDNTQFLTFGQDYFFSNNNLNSLIEAGKKNYFYFRYN